MMTAEDAPAGSLTVVARPDTPGDQAPVTVRLAFDAPPAMPVGSPVLLRIVAEVHQGATLVPLGAVIYDGDAASVYVVSNGKAQRVPVTVGITNDTHAEITSGLEPGAMVAIESDSDLFDGAKVTIR
jgi:multidrug efflux pump subunit AcrA (membrane-fusion protein)